MTKLAIAASIAAIWMCIGVWLIVTRRAGYTISGKAPWYVRYFADIMTVVLAPPLYFITLITGKDIG
jgi:hypothetical protein